MKTVPISAWESKLRLGEFNPEIGALRFRRRDWVGCITGTTEPPDITLEGPGDQANVELRFL
jgi:hypothetical protein